MLVVGIDEVGRGSIAGPLVVGAVILKSPITGLRDSKVLSRSKREQLADQITKAAIFTGLGWVSVQELDRIGLTRSLTLATERALSKLNLSLDMRYILDGNYNYLPNKYAPVELVIRGDASVAAISAASILAKVARDDYMIKLAEQYPEFGFERHVGYATVAHLEALATRGVQLCHRQTFEPVKSMLKAAYSA